MRRSSGGGEATEATVGVHATLMSGGLETHYRKAGAGEPVLLLGGGGKPSAMTHQLFERLSRHFRVIYPDPPHPCADAGRETPRGSEAAPTSVAAWLRGIIDGLGLEGCALLAEPPFSLAAIWFAFTDPHRVARLVLLVPDGPDPVLPMQEALQAIEGTGQAIMLIRVEPASGRALLPEDMISRLTSFLQRVWRTK